MLYRLSSFIHQGLSSYYIARNSGQIHLWLISLIAIYTPFEDLIVAWLPLPGVVQTGIRFIPELTIYLILLQVLGQRIIKGSGLQKSIIDFLLLAFVLATGISMILNQSSIFPSLANLRSIWRYLALYYTLINLPLAKNQVIQLLKIIKVVGLVQAVIACVQFFLPGGLKIALAAGNCEKGAIKNASCGTFLDSANLSGFLLLVIGVILSIIYANCDYLVPPLRDTFSLGIFYFGMFASKKRAALIMSLILIILVFTFFQRFRNTRILVWLISAMAIAVIFIYPLLTLDLDIGQREIGEEVPNITSYFLSVFSPEYWDHTLSASRGWVVTKVCQTIWESSSWFGFGPDQATLINNMGQFLTSDEVKKLVRDAEVFDDPYWFAMLGYFGVVGLGINWLILFRLYQIGQNLLKITQVKEYQILAVSFCSIVFVAFFYSFVERVFRLRHFSFYFWLLAGLVVNVYQSQVKEQIESYESNIDR
ncbi:MAG: hypothetical protein AAGE84_29555 [Cyanobacteria bacterium P01_G01_bin.39]